MTVQTWLIEISEEECVELLASTNLGRLGVVLDGRPEIFPVNHVFDPSSGGVAFPTNARSKLRGALDWPSVAFEVDGLDDDSGGWSVVVQGAAEEIRDPGEIERLAADRRVVWWPGAHPRWIRIVPSKITGRRISAVTG